MDRPVKPGGDDFLVTVIITVMPRFMRGIHGRVYGGGPRLDRLVPLWLECRNSKQPWDGDG
jgi:hypothetical protein